MNTTNNNDDLLNDDPEQSSRRNITKSDDMPDYELEDPDDILNDDVDDFIDEDMDYSDSNSPYDENDADAVFDRQEKDKKRSNIIRRIILLISVAVFIFAANNFPFKGHDALIGLMVAVGVLRASGFLDFIAELLSGVCGKLGIPASIVPLIIVRLFSSSAATGLSLDIFKQYGTDSYTGLITSILMGCTETVFYTMSVYYMAARIKKTRWTLAGALIATVAGIAASVILARCIS